MSQILGILNITADSFSDGGRYLAPDAALAQARLLKEGGADILDVGPASSHPDAADVSPEEEIARLEAVWAGLCDLGLPISVDSFQPATQRWAADHGAAFLNDIQGFPDPEQYPWLKDSGCRLIVMHSVQAKGKATRAETDPATIWERLDRFFDARLEALMAAGIGRERLILDPGMGFFLGSDPEVSLKVLRELPRLDARYGLPVLVSVSRKSFLRTLTGRSTAQSGPATLAAELHAAAAGAAFIRTHDAAALKDALILREALEG